MIQSGNFKHGLFDASYASQVIHLTRRLDMAHAAVDRADKHRQFRAIARDIVATHDLDADMDVYSQLIQRPSTYIRMYDLFGQRANMTDDEIMTHVGMLAASLAFLDDDLRADMIDYLRSLDDILRSQTWAADALAASTCS